MNGRYPPDNVCRRLECSDYRENTRNYCGLSSCKYSVGQREVLLGINAVDMASKFSKDQLEGLVNFAEIVQRSVKRD